MNDILYIPLLFGSFGWGEILIIAFILIIVISFIVIVFRALSRKRSSYMDKTYQPTSVADELAKLSKLRDKGILTDEEFEALKKKLLK